MLFKKENREFDKSIIEKYIFDESIKKEIIDKIEYFTKNGKMVKNDNELYGKSNNGKDFFELKFIGNNLLCDYTEYELSNIISISAKVLENSNIKLERTEKTEYKNDSHNTIKEERIVEEYTSDMNKFYELKTFTEKGLDPEKNIQVILILENEKVKELKDALFLGIYDFVFDPFDLDEVCTKITNPNPFSKISKYIKEIQELEL